MNIFKQVFTKIYTYAIEDASLLTSALLVHMVLVYLTNKRKDIWKYIKILIVTQEVVPLYEHMQLVQSDYFIVQTSDAKTRSEVLSPFRPLQIILSSFHCQCIPRRTNSYFPADWCPIQFIKSSWSPWYSWGYWHRYHSCTCIWISLVQGLYCWMHN